MHKYLYFFFIIINTCSTTIYGQCGEENFAFTAGEEVKYDAYYNWHFIWLHAGQVTFSVENSNDQKMPTWLLKAYGKTFSGYDKLFSVRDSFETWVIPETLEPLEFHRKTLEGSYQAHHHYLFSKTNDAIFYRISRKGSPYKKDTINWQDCTSDLLSMVYKARNIDFEKYEKNEKIPIRMIVDGEIHDLYIRYLGFETIKNRDNRQFRCFKFSPLLVKGTMFESGEEMIVWVTADKNRIPIIVEAKILIGSVKAVFVSGKGLKNPMEAEVF